MRWFAKFKESIRPREVQPDSFTSVGADLRKLATVRFVDSVAPIEGADNIETARIGGWDVVVKRGEFVAGALAVYFEVDAILPADDHRYSFLGSPKALSTADGSTYIGYRLRTVKLRGQISQGLLIHVSEFPEILQFLDMVSDGELESGLDVSELLGIEKYEKPVPAALRGNAAGHFPTSLVRKTDSERAQNLSKSWEALRGYQWTCTEKIDGMSLTVLNDAGTIRVCSRNYELVDGENVFWNAAGFLKDSLPEDHFVQAEIYGPGIQANSLKVTELRVAVFAYGQLRDMKPLPRGQWPAGVAEHATPYYWEGALPETIADAIAQADGIRSLVNPACLAEGVVYHTVGGETPPGLSRPNFKVISNKYLLKEK
jgi:RNA ligase (TIGR02306 family)